MINLIDKAVYAELKAARVNIILRRYVFFFLLAALLMAAMFGIGYLLLQGSLASAQQLSDASAREKASYSKTIAESKAFHKDLATAKTIFTSEVPMSDIIIRIAKTLPSRALLDNVALSQSNLNTQMSFSVLTQRVADTDAVTNAFRNSPYFSGITLMSASTEEEEVSAHPVTITFTATPNVPKIVADARTLQ